MSYWITGRAGSGKTTLAHKLARQIPNGVVIDGDETRKYWKSDFTREGRFQNQRNIVRIAKMLELQGCVPIIACVSPDKLLRGILQEQLKDCIEIQMPFGKLWEGTTYEE